MRIEFADLCTDVNCQIDNLPGLACLNYPEAIRPIVEKLPTSLRTKWEKEVVQHAESHDDAYPGFNIFTRVVKSQAKIKNHPNILAGSPQRHSLEVHKDRPKDQRTLKTNVGEENENHQNPTVPTAKMKKCPYHKCEGHNLIECKAFATKPLAEKTEYIQKAGLCFRCLKEGHQAKKCKANVTCTVCESNRHPTLLHKEKIQPDKKDTNQEDGEEDDSQQVVSKCTEICGDNKGVVS